MRLNLRTALHRLAAGAAVALVVTSAAIGTTASAATATRAVGVSAAAAATPAVTAVPAENSGPHFLYVHISGKFRCLEDRGSSHAAGVHIDTWTCESYKANEEWDALGPYVRNGALYVLWKNVASGLCMNVSGYSKANGAPIIQWPCSSTYTNELFKEGSTEVGDSVMYKNDYSGKCLNVEGYGTANGTPLIQWTCGGVNGEPSTYPANEMIDVD